ncbi:hypothetical protein ACHQM5_008789 [Ranunculus cassubicifolius]
MRMTKVAEEDRISSLPEQLLGHILSFIDTIQAVHTCLLSKTWRYSWKSLPDLYFDDDPKIQDFEQFVDNVLANFPDGARIHKFTLRNWTETSDSFDQLNNWMESPILRNIQELQLEHRIRISPTSLIGQVKTLTLKSVEFSPCGDKNDHVEFKFPVVENMVLDHCCWNELKFLVISAPRLRSLSVDSFWSVRESVKISAPNLITLYLKVTVGNEVSFDPLPFLVRAEIETDIDTTNPKKYIDIGKKKVLLLTKIFKQVSNARSLTLSTNDFQLWPELVLESLKRDRIQFHSAKNLKLKDCNLKGDIHVIATFLESFPGLETLVMVNSAPCIVISKQKPPTVSNCDFRNLTSVEIQQYNGQENEFNLLEFIVRRAMSLEKIVIAVEVEVTSGDSRGKTLRSSLVRRLKSWGVAPKLIDTDLERVGSAKAAKRRRKNEVKNFEDLNTTELQYFSLGLKIC